MKVFPIASRSVEEWGLERLQGLRSVYSCPDARSVGVCKSEARVVSPAPAPSGCGYGVTAGPPDAPPSTHLPLVPELPALVLWDSSSCSGPLWLTQYISCSVRLPPLSPSLSPSQLHIPSSGKAHFWFPYKSWLWSVEVTVIPLFY